MERSTMKWLPYQRKSETIPPEFTQQINWGNWWVFMAERAVANSDAKAAKKYIADSKRCWMEADEIAGSCRLRKRTAAQTFFGYDASNRVERSLGYLEGRQRYGDKPNWWQQIVIFLRYRDNMPKPDKQKAEL
jgi:hypothetical protein